MGIIIEFNEEHYRNAVKNGFCDPIAVFAPFINIDIQKYLKLKIKQPKIEELEKRLGRATFAQLRGAIGFTLRHANLFHPTYRIIAGEIINEEWLAMVDWHKYHRDHLTHQPMSIYVGFTLLSTLKLRGKTLLERCLEAILEGENCKYLKEYLKDMKAPKIYFNKSFEKIFWKNILFDTFYLATLFHDMGYPWKFVNIIHRELSDEGSITNPSGQGADWIAKRYGKRLIFYPLNNYRKTDHSRPGYWPEVFRSIIVEGLSRTHGIAGAISLLYLNDLIRKYPDNNDYPVRRFCVEWASMAIMMHDMANIYWGHEDRKIKPKYPQLRLSLDKDPLSWVLTLTDLVQDFARTDADFNIKGVDEALVKYVSRCKSVKIDWNRDDEILSIIYCYNNPGDWIKHRDTYLPETQYRYFDPNYGYLDYRGTGISKIILVAELV